VARQKIESGKCAKWWRRRGSKQADSGISTATTTGHRRKTARKNKIARHSPGVEARPHQSSASGENTGRRHGRLRQSAVSLSHEIRRTPAEKKFAKIERFGEYLPKLRRITNEHMALEGFPREKVLAVMMRLINSLYIRLGTEKSVKHYKTYGITTLQNRHLEIGSKENWFQLRRQASHQTSQGAGR
jgi:hypothetical protein